MFCVVALLVFEKLVHFGSDASGHVTMINHFRRKLTGIQLSQDRKDDLPNIVDLQNFDFKR